MFTQRANVSNGGVGDFACQGLKPLNGFRCLVANQFLRIVVRHHLEAGLHLLGQRFFRFELCLALGDAEVGTLSHANCSKVTGIRQIFLPENGVFTWLPSILEQELSEARTKIAAMARRRYGGHRLNLRAISINNAQIVPKPTIFFCCGKLYVCDVSCRANETGREYFWES